MMRIKKSGGKETILSNEAFRGLFPNLEDARLYLAVDLETSDFLMLRLLLSCFITSDDEWCCSFDPILPLLSHSDDCSPIWVERAGWRSFQVEKLSHWISRHGAPYPSLPAFLSYAIATRAPGAQTLDIINNFGYDKQQQKNSPSVTPKHLSYTYSCSSGSAVTVPHILLQAFLSFN